MAGMSSSASYCALADGSSTDFQRSPNRLANASPTCRTDPGRPPSRRAAARPTRPAAPAVHRTSGRRARVDPGRPAGRGEHEIDHPGDDVLPVGPHRLAALVQHLPGAWSVEHGDRPAAIDGRSTPTSRAPPPCRRSHRCGRSSGTARRPLGRRGTRGCRPRHGAGLREVRQRRPERLHAGGVRRRELVAVEAVAMPEERLAVVLRRSEVQAGRADGVACGEGTVGLLHQPVGEARPRGVPAVAVAWCDLRRDVQALAHVGHPGVALCDAALQLAVERRVVEEQLHLVPSVDGSDPSRARSRLA